jgi:hypothetical protein
MGTDVDDFKSDLNAALNEATLVGVALDVATRRANLTFAVLSLPESGPPPEDPRILMVLHPVGRLAVSYRQGRWDDDRAAVVPLRVEQLMDVVVSFGGQPIYGWDFIDGPEAGFQQWSGRLSLDLQFEDFGRTHTLEVFQESALGPARHLDARIWFDDLHIFRKAGQDLIRIPLATFAADGRRWWDGLHRQDPRTQGHGIIAGVGGTPKDVERVMRTLDQRKPGSH